MHGEYNGNGRDQQTGGRVIVMRGKNVYRVQRPKRSRSDQQYQSVGDRQA